MSELQKVPMKFGVVTGQHQLSWNQIVEQWQLAESLVFDSVWLFDHFMALYGNPEGPCLEASTLLAALALKTSRIKIGVLVYGNTHRHPAIFAKEMVTVDHISDGRLILGIGTGWNEREHEAYAMPFPGAGDRVEMLEESLQIIESLFTEPRTTFNGKHYQLVEAPFAPKPIQAKLPILIGGRRPRMLKLIARHADYWDSSSSPEELRERLLQIGVHCREIGRDPREITASVSLGADQIENAATFAGTVRAYRAAGAGQLLYDFPISREGTRTAEMVAREIIPALREEFQ